MATFFNRATLTYNNTTTTSNTVSGEIVGLLAINKTALTEIYIGNDTVTYVINITNSGASDFGGLVLSDDLGAYPFGGETLVPLTYVDGSIRQFTNGVPIATVNVTDTSPLTVSNLQVPQNGTTTIVYQAQTNEFAPFGETASITNTATLSSALLGNIAEATETISAGNSPLLTIEKALSPTTVSPNGQITYTFTIRNFGGAEAGADENIILTDIFDPILSNISVTYNGTPLSSPDDYTYDPATGLFTTVEGRITVPAATFSQDPQTGEWISTPGVTVLTVTGNV